MGVLYSFLIHYNALRKPRFFIPTSSAQQTNNQAELSTVEPSFLLDVVAQNEAIIPFTAGSLAYKQTLLKTLASTCPGLFFVRNQQLTKSNPLFSKSFRCLKKILRPLITLYHFDFRQMPSHTRRVLRRSEDERLFLVLFMLHKFFLTHASRFALGFLGGRAITAREQYYIFYFRLVSYDFSLLK